MSSSSLRVFTVTYALFDISNLLKQFENREKNMRKKRMTVKIIIIIEREKEKKGERKKGGRKDRRDSVKERERKNNGTQSAINYRK